MRGALHSVRSPGKCGHSTQKARLLHKAFSALAEQIHREHHKKGNRECVNCHNSVSELKNHVGVCKGLEAWKM